MIRILLCKLHYNSIYVFYIIIFLLFKKLNYYNPIFKCILILLILCSVH